MRGDTDFEQKLFALSRRNFATPGIAAIRHAAALRQKKRKLVGSVCGVLLVAATTWYWLDRAASAPVAQPGESHSAFELSWNTLFERERPRSEEGAFWRIDVSEALEAGGSYSGRF